MQFLQLFYIDNYTCSSLHLSPAPLITKLHVFRTVLSLFVSRGQTNSAKFRISRCSCTARNRAVDLGKSFPIYKVTTGGRPEFRKTFARSVPHIVARRRKKRRSYYVQQSVCMCCVCVYVCVCIYVYMYVRFLSIYICLRSDAGAILR